MALIHGGQLQKVAKQYNIPAENWLDLSTGIAPLSYPIPSIPLNAWQQLPQNNIELITAAKQYYQCEQIIVTNGSQAIIKALPALYYQTFSSQKLQHQELCCQNLSNSIDVFLPMRGYKEHAYAWENANYTLHFYQESLPEISKLTPNSVVVIINPNNPTGQFFSRDILSKYHNKLKQINGLLVIDEAFIDVMPREQSYCQSIKDRHCFVLRSFGKFFGLAGIRIGFLITDNYWSTQFENVLGPWQVNGPAQIIAKKALIDNQWHSKQRITLHSLRVQQETLLWQVFTEELVKDIQGSDLFLTLNFHQQNIAKEIYHLLCQQGVYCRLADEQDTLRFGICLIENFNRLASACVQACAQLALSKL